MRLVKRSILLVLGLTFILVGLSVWLTQPLFSNATFSSNERRADRGKLQTHVSKISQEFYPRNHLNLKNLDATADYIGDEFAKTGGNVSEQKFVVNNASYRNIVLRFGDASKERIVVGAHYDAAYETHGADDNASGVAGLIELAHLLAKENHSVPIELVAYSLEEPPFFSTENMGSYVHAKSLYDDGVRVKLMISLEMIGYYSDEPNSQGFPFILGQLLYSTTGNFVALVGNFSNVKTVRDFKYSMTAIDGLSTCSLNAPAFVGGVDLSDHRNYWRFGYDALMVTDTAFFRNKTYHTIHDTSDRLDYDKMAKVVDGVKAAVLDVAK